jgi:SsrA-binding protein
MKLLELKSNRATPRESKRCLWDREVRRAWLLNCHISPYSHGNYANHEPLRTRKCC